MFQFTFGDVGSGKTIDHVNTSLDLLKRSVKIEKKYKLGIRQIWSNFHLSSEIETKYKERFFTWHDPLEMIFIDYPKNTQIRRDFDCLWDEMAVELPSDRWKEVDPEIRRFFAQHRKRGIQIYGNTQDYMMLDINARRMATRVFQTHKIIGNRDPSSTLPKIRFIWGLIAKWELDKACIRSDDMLRKHVSLLPLWLVISRRLVNAYDTGEDIAKCRDSFKHLTRECLVCGYKKIIHV